MRLILDEFSRDLTHGLRLLRRNPGFAAVIVSTLAVGIAATVTVASIVDAWLFRPLNFPSADRLVIAFAAAPDTPTEPAVWLPYRAYLAWKAQSRSFTSLSAAFFRGVTITTPDDARSSVGLDVSPDFFQTFGVSPLLGRALTESDVTGPPVIVLNHGLWIRHFAGSPDVIGKSIQLSDVPHQVVGVMPSDMDVRILDRPEGLEFFTPLKDHTAGYTAGGMGPVAIVGRLREGLPIATAQSEVARITRMTESGYQMNFNQFVVNLTSLQADNSRTIRSTLLTVAAAVVCLLLIGAMNVSGLILGRGIGRMREAAVRVALGSGRSRLIRQFLTESLLVSAIGGLAGIALAVGAIKLFIAWNPLGTLPANAIQIDVRVLAIAGLAMLATTAICGLVPALRVSSVDPNGVLHAGGDRGGTIPTERTQTVLLVGQMAICVVVLVAATLLTQTFKRLNAEPLGFDAANLWVASITLPSDPFDTADERNAYYRQLDEAVRSLPGVSAVAASTAPPLNSGPVVTVNTGPTDSPQAPRIGTQDVTTSFFAALEVPLLAGRLFEARDVSNGSPVLVVNARASQQLFGGLTGAIGQRVRLGSGPWREVIGVVGNVRSSFFNTLEWRTDPILYRPATQAFSTVDNPSATSFGFFLHVRASRALSLAALRNASSSVSARASVTELQRVSDAIGAATRQPALRMRLLVALSSVNLLLAAIGVYGIVSQALAYRRREVAIRIVLGAAPGAIIATVTRRVLLTGVAGMIAGILAALTLSRTLDTILYGVRSRDLLPFAVASAALLGVTAIAALIPARRAIRVDPVTVLRAD